MAFSTGRFLTVASAANRPPGGEGLGKKTSGKLSHPGYSLFDWKRFCDSFPIIESQPIKVHLAELSRHSTEDDCWTAIRGKVYNVTHFLKYHPGRKAQLMRGAGLDSTELFDKVHSWVNEESILHKFIVGYLVPGEEPIFDSFRVSDVEAVSHNTRLFILENSLSAKLVVPAGQYVRLKATTKGETIVREYTPVVKFDKDENHRLMLMVKLYPHGKMTQYLSTIKAGDNLQINGPCGHFCADEVCSSKVLVLIAAGSGLTPMISLMKIRHRQSNPLQSTLLLFANRAEEDILWREKLNVLCYSSPQFKVVHILSSPSSNWTGESGRLSLPLLTKYIPNSSEDVRVFISGPALFSRTIVENLTNLHYPDGVIHCFD